MASAGDITRILEEMRSGKGEAPAELLSLLYGELRDLAGAAMKRERENHTLQPTALVNEACLRLMADKGASWENRAHFFGAAATVMRRVLVDYARSRQADKRGGGRQRVSIAGMEPAAALSSEVDLIALHEALEKLAEVDSRKGRLVELRFFGGLGFSEAAEVLGVSEITAKRDWSYAKAWLYRRIAADENHDS